jgi:beta-phosphoglucomutase-like phosphatase (HAD superfamily)
VVGHLARFGLDQSFDCIKTADDVERVKPDPALYLAALGALDARADEALAFEDSPNGALAATRAGIYCVVVPNRLTQQLAHDAANLRLASLADLPLSALLARVDRIGAAGARA